MALTRYYCDAGAGGVAVGVHTTQFAIRSAGLLEPVLRLAAGVVREREAASGRRLVKVAGVVGPTAQAVAEAGLARDLGYDLGLLSLGALREATTDELLAHCRQVAEVLPLFGFYLQPAVGGRVLDEGFWRRFLEIGAVAAIKVAPFNRYHTLDVARALAASGRGAEVALYTGNDDAIVADLLARFEPARGSLPVRFAGGLLGQWAVWTRRAVELLQEVKECRRTRPGGLRPARARPAAHRRQRRALRRPPRLRRLHRRDPRGAAAAGAAGRAVVPGPARGPLAGAGGGDRPRPPGLPPPHRRRVRRGEPRAMAELSPLLEIVSAQKRGEARGVFSVCSAHPVVLQAAFEQAREDGSTVLVESTSNQVNQEGGYTGVRPAEFVAFVSRLARGGGAARRTAWSWAAITWGRTPGRRSGPASRWPARRRWCGDYVRAGYAKVHLDASMRCADDPLGPLADTVAAARTADLAAAAEAAAAERAPGVPAPALRDRDRGPAARRPGRRPRGAGRHARRGRRAEASTSPARPSRDGGSSGPGGG